MAATQTMLGSFGCTMMRAIDCVSFRPRLTNVMSSAFAVAALVLFQMPLPHEEVCRLFASPVPT